MFRLNPLIKGAQVINKTHMSDKLTIETLMCTLISVHVTVVYVFLHEMSVVELYFMAFMFMYYAITYFVSVYFKLQTKMKSDMIVNQLTELVKDLGKPKTKEKYKLDPNTDLIPPVPGDVNDVSSK